MQAVIAPLQQPVPDWEACFLAISSVLDRLEDCGDILEPPFAQLAGKNQCLSQLLDKHSASLSGQIFAAYEEHTASGCRQLTDLLLQQHKPQQAQEALQSLCSLADTRAVPPVSPAAASDKKQSQSAVAEGSTSVDGLGWIDPTPTCSIPDTPTLLRQAGRSHCIQ